MFIIQINFSKREIDIFDPEKLAFSFLVDFKIFNVFHFSSFLVPEGDFVARITFFLSFQEAPRGKPRLLWMVSEVLWEYQPKRIQNFQEIFDFHKKIFKTSFSMTGPNSPNSVLLSELRRSSTSYHIFPSNQCFKVKTNREPSRPFAWRKLKGELKEA